MTYYRQPRDDGWREVTLSSIHALGRARLLVGASDDRSLWLVPQAGHYFVGMLNVIGPLA